MTIPTIAALPTAPARTDAPATFVTRADAFVAALPTLRTEINTTTTAIDAVASTVDDDKVLASASQVAAASSATNAAASATAADATANATLWVSAGSYTAGQNRYSPINYLTYRAITTHSGETTDPSLDATNWVSIVVQPVDGSMILLSTVTAASSATVDVETTFNSTYDVYKLVVSGLTVANDGAAIHIRLKVGGSYVTTAIYGYHAQSGTSGSASYASNVAETGTSIQISAQGVGNGASDSFNLVVMIYNPSSTALVKQIDWRGTASRTVVAQRTNIASGGALVTNTAALTGVRFYAATGNILTGKFRLYGINNGA